MTSGVLRFDQFMERALYDPESGFFAGAETSGGQAGRSGGDFITSPEVGPLFGALVAEFLDERWNAAGRPEAFDVIEYAAGRGALAISIRAAQPACSGALRYHLVERSERLIARQAEHLQTVRVDSRDDFEAALDPAPPAEKSVSDKRQPQFFSHASSGSLPEHVDVVLANELLDNLPFRLFERGAAGHWQEVAVHERVPGMWEEQLLQPDAELSQRLQLLAPGAPAGARAPLQSAATEWLAQQLRRTGFGSESGDRLAGAVVVVDYARTTSEMSSVSQSEWLRTYRSHARGGPPTDDPGSQDITCDVATDQLLAVREPTALLNQAEWLRNLGIDRLVDEGRIEWQAKVTNPDLAAMRARSRIREAEALLDPTGLGGFQVFIWTA